MWWWIPPFWWLCLFIYVGFPLACAKKHCVLKVRKRHCWSWSIVSKILQICFLLGMFLPIPIAASGLELCATTSHPMLKSLTSVLDYLIDVCKFLIHLGISPIYFTFTFNIIFSMMCLLKILIGYKVFQSFNVLIWKVWIIWFLAHFPCSSFFHAQISLIINIYS